MIAGPMKSQGKRPAHATSAAPFVKIRVIRGQNLFTSAAPEWVKQTPTQDHDTVPPAVAGISTSPAHSRFLPASATDIPPATLNNLVKSTIPAKPIPHESRRISHKVSGYLDGSAKIPWHLIYY